MVLERQINDKRAAILRIASSTMPQHVIMDKLQMQLMILEIQELKLLIFSTFVNGRESEHMQAVYHHSLFTNYLAWLENAEREATQSALGIPRANGLHLP